MRAFPCPMLAAMVFALVAPGPLAADPATPLSGEAFEAEVTGRTLTYSENGTVYGAEQYLPGRRVLWRFVGEECQPGRWFPRGDAICFTYDADLQEHCWRFWRDGDALTARLITDGPEVALSRIAQSVQPLACNGPEVGV